MTARRPRTPSGRQTWTALTAKRTRFRPQATALEDRVTPVVTTTFLAGVLTFTSDGANDKVLVQSTTTSGTVDYDDGNSLGTATQAGVTQVVFNGNGGADQFTLVQVNPGIFAPAGGIQFDGGAGSDTLSLAGGSNATFTGGTYTVTGPDSGTVNYATTGGAVNVTFSGNELINDTTASALFTTKTSTGPESVAINPGGPLPGFGIKQGPVFLDGGDRDDHGSASAGVNQNGWKFIEQAVNFVHSKSINGAPSDVLVIGVNTVGSQAHNAITSVLAALGLTGTFITATAGANSIATVNFNLYDMIYVPSDANTGGGITQAQVNALNARVNDVRDFVRNGGGVVALTEQATTNPYGWLQIPNPFTIGNTNNDTMIQDPNLAAAGFTITNAELSAGTPVHNHFTGPPGFNGLLVFVRNGTNQVITLGQGSVDKSTPGSPTSTVISGSAMTTVQVALKDGLVVDGQGGADGITVNTTGPANLTVNGGDGGDTVQINYAAGPNFPGVVILNDTGATGDDKATLSVLSASANVFEVNNPTPPYAGVQAVAVDGVKVLTYVGATQERLDLDGQGGADVYNVYYQDPNAPGSDLPNMVCVMDSGAAGTTDIVNLYGTINADNIDVNFTAAQMATSGPETVCYTANLETLNVYGKDEPGQFGDTFTVYPDPSTAINIFGGLPVYPDTPGDTLQLSILRPGNPGATVGNPSISTPSLPNGTLTSSTHKTVTWQLIETLPVPLGLGGGFDMGTKTSPVQPGFRRVTSADTFTGAPFAGIYGWQTSPGEFDRFGSPYWPVKSGLLFDPSAKLLGDGHWAGQGQNTFTVAVGKGQDTFVTLFFGDTYSGYNGIQVYFDGALQGTVDTKVDVLSTFARRYTTNGTGRLDITVKQPFPSTYWILNGADVRPVSLAAPLSIAREDGKAGTIPFLADGLIADKFVVSGAQPNELLTVTSSLAAVGGPDFSYFVNSDLDLYLAGVQVRADAFGVAVLELRRPTGTGPAVIHVAGAYGEANSDFDTVNGTATLPPAKDFVQTYVLPSYPLAPATAIRRLDFNNPGSPTAAGFVAVTAGSTYTSTAFDALGWVGTSASGFDRSTADPLLRDGNWGYGGASRDFRLDFAAPGTYYVTLTMGDPIAARDQMKVTAAVGTILAPADPTLVTPTGIGAPAGQSASVSFQVTTDGAGKAVLRFDDAGGDPVWTVQGLEVRAARAPLTVTLQSPATVPADGVTVATYRVTGATSGAVMSVGTTFGNVVGVSTSGGAGTFTADQSALFTGPQAVADGTGTFYFQVVPLNATSDIAATVYASDVTGAAAGTLAQTFTGVSAGPTTTAYRFDFNGPSANTQTGFTGVRGTELFDPTKGYGWVAGVAEYERTTANVQASTFPLFRDGVYGIGFNAGVFQAAVTAGGTGAARVYVGDSASAYAVEVQAEGNSTWTPLTTFANTFQTVVVFGTDANSDGRFEVRVRAAIPSSYWVTNGMDVANTVANLPVQAQPTTNAPVVVNARYDFGNGPSAAGFTGVSGSSLATAAQGYGWQAGVADFDRGPVTSAVTQDLYRDAVWGFGTTNGVFRVAIPAGGSAAARAYFGDWYAGWQGIEVRAEGGSFVPVGALNKDQYTNVPVSGSDVNGDGWFDITVRNADPNGIWVFNGVDVSATAGGLPPAAP